MDLKGQAKALADLKAGKNLPEAIRVLYHTQMEDEVKLLSEIYTADPAIRMAMHPAEAKEIGSEGHRFVHADLGPLTHDGDDYVGKHKTVLYPRKAVEVRLEPELYRAAAVTDVWRAFCKREKKLRSELQKAVAKRYKDLRSGAAFLKLKPMKQSCDIWKTLGRPTILIRRARKRPEIGIAWSPKWEPEHGLRVYLTPKATIRELE